jgi:dihydropteroate synthase
MFKWGSRTFVMGILNITPDSFSGDGLMSQPDVVAAAIEQARRFVQAGADILDIGGESTRPGAQPVSIDQEMERVLPVLSGLHQAGLDAVLSIDTSKSEVAEAALKIAPAWINDVWGLRVDPRLAEVAARQGATLILMHNRSQPDSVELRQRLGGRYLGSRYANLLDDVRKELLESVALAKAAGVADEAILLDPGIGFGKSVAHNLELINRLGEIRALGYPVLFGPSRKSFIGYTLNLPSDQRLEGTAAAVAVGITRGADIIRVHDVKTMVRVARMTDAIVRAR